MVEIFNGLQSEARVIKSFTQQLFRLATGPMYSLNQAHSKPKQGVGFLPAGEGSRK